MTSTVPGRDGGRWNTSGAFIGVPRHRARIDRVSHLKTPERERALAPNSKAGDRNARFSVEMKVKEGWNSSYLTAEKTYFASRNGRPGE